MLVPSEGISMDSERLASAQRTEGGSAPAARPYVGFNMDSF